MGLGVKRTAAYSCRPNRKPTIGLLSYRNEIDDLCVDGREYYWLCRIRSTESKIWTSAAMRALKLPTSSMRNLTTVRKLAALYPVPGE